MRSHTAGIPAFLAAASAPSCVAANSVRSSAVVPEPRRRLLHLPAVAPALRSTLDVVAHGLHCLDWRLRCDVATVGWHAAAGATPSCHNRLFRNRQDCAAFPTPARRAPVLLGMLPAQNETIRYLYTRPDRDMPDGERTKIRIRCRQTSLWDMAPVGPTPQWYLP